MPAGANEGGVGEPNAIHDAMSLRKEDAQVDAAAIHLAGMHYRALVLEEDPRSGGQEPVGGSSPIHFAGHALQVLAVTPLR
jgi:hypothetical protein